MKNKFKNCEIKIRPIKINKFNLRWRKVRLGPPSFFLSHFSFSNLFETLSGRPCSRITYQQSNSRSGQKQRPKEKHRIQPPWMSKQEKTRSIGWGRGFSRVTTVRAHETRYLSDHNHR